MWEVGCGIDLPGWVGGLVGEEGWWWWWMGEVGGGRWEVGGEGEFGGLGWRGWRNWRREEGGGRKEDVLGVEKQVFCGRKVEGLV